MSTAARARLRTMRRSRKSSGTRQTVLNVSTLRYIRLAASVTMAASISSKAGNMKSKATRLSVLLAVLVGLAATVLPVAPADAQWVFVARKALGRIQHMAESQQQGGRPGYDFATVLLDAPADKVFATALELARKNPSVRVVMQDPGQRRFQIAEGDRTATLNVVPFSDDVSQLLIAGHAASPAEGSTASRVVQAVLRVCKEMGKHCEVGG
jgi:hypothetical protein